MTAAAAGLTRRVTRAEANLLLIDWGHYLGPVTRPFGAECWVLEADGRPVSVAVGASTVSATVAWTIADQGYRLARREVVELARLCSAPDARWATRPMLRLWREIAAPRWPHWPVVAAVAYSQNAKHPGDIYRFDGWTRINTKAGSTGGGGTWSKQRHAGITAAGRKSLWLWRYPEGITS